MEPVLAAAAVVMGHNEVLGLRRRLEGCMEPVWAVAVAMGHIEVLGLAAAEDMPMEPAAEVDFGTYHRTGMGIDIVLAIGSIGSVVDRTMEDWSRRTVR